MARRDLWGLGRCHKRQGADVRESSQRQIFRADRLSREIQYDGSNLKWGSQIPGYGPRHQWFKLGLDTTSGRAESALPAQYQDPLAVPADYM